MDRTIFFSVATRDVYRNFFFFQGALFSRLVARIERGEPIRIVLVVQPKHYDDFKGYAREDGSILVEPAHVELRKSFIQKLFTFFYSYLVYTGTTRTLATIGMRAEDAPGAGRRMLNPAKRLLSFAFGWSRFLKIRLVPFFYFLFFRKDIYTGLFERYHPDMVFVPHLFSSFDMAFLASAKRRGVSTLGMVTNWDHFDKYYLPLHADTLLVQSRQIEEFALRYQAYDMRDVRLVGYPYFDFLFDVRYHMEREDVLSYLGFPPESRYMLYIAGSMYCPDEPDIIEQILQWIDDGYFGNDMRLVIRPYPGVRGKDLDFDEEKFESFKRHPRISFYLGTFWGDEEKSAAFMGTVRNAAAVIAVYSTAALEAVALDRPVVVPSFDGNRSRPFSRSVRRFELREHFAGVLATGGVRKINNFNELRAALSEYCANPAVDKYKREALRQFAAGPLDGGASKRVLEHMLALVYTTKT